MPELQFKGKEFVYNHHLTVPFRPLEKQADKSIGDARLDGNLIVHGDNLLALKALLPMYAGKVDCVFIDPPYNTGNEGWACAPVTFDYPAQGLRGGRLNSGLPSPSRSSLACQDDRPWFP
ncbi:hypothetical protein [Novosphingobium sp.]|uniref:hypothetical protein n=1 Tax=Novosphingobium sp. TaxID=1874826 RepID=UPI00261FDD80|nr:hypothetical protein [Novosphingobium sp.]